MATKHKANPDNVNCLEGIVCPQCGNTDHFAVEVKQFVGLTDNGTDAYDDALNAAEVDSNIEYDDESAMVCVECKHHAKMAEFHSPEQPLGAVYWNYN
jgi:Zn ribbon nucleic-acid-binding protein